MSQPGKVKPLAKQPQSARDKGDRKPESGPQRAARLRELARKVIGR